MIDEQLMFSDAQAITATAASTNIVKLGTREVAFGNPVPLEIQIKEAFNTLTSLKIAVETDSVAAFSSAVELASCTILLADLTAGKKIPLVFLPAGNKGYVRMKYTVTGSNPSTGKITAFISDGQEQSFHS